MKPDPKSKPEADANAQSKPEGDASASPKPDADAKANADTEPDFYYDEQGRFVFTRSYHLRRGFCCMSGCLHCPYDEDGNPISL